MWNWIVSQHTSTHFKVKKTINYRRYLLNDDCFTKQWIYGNFLKSPSQASIKDWVCVDFTISSSKCWTWFHIWGAPLRIWLLCLGCALENLLGLESCMIGYQGNSQRSTRPQCVQGHLSWTSCLMLFYFSIDLPEESQSQTAASNFICFYLLNFFAIDGILSLMLFVWHIKKFLGLFPKA